MNVVHAYKKKCINFVTNEKGYFKKCNIKNNANLCCIYYCYLSRYIHIVGHRRVTVTSLPLQRPNKWYRSHNYRYRGIVTITKAQQKIVSATSLPLLRVQHSRERLPRERQIRVEQQLWKQQPRQLKPFMHPQEQQPKE